MADSGLGRVLAWAWDNRAFILDALRTVRDWFRSDPGRGILIIGAGGVGKSTLAAILSGSFDWLLSEPWRYDESYGVEEFNLRDDPKVNIVVPPGQAQRRESAWSDVERDLAAGKYRGVIVVSANGYHALGPPGYRAHALYRGNKDEFLAAFRMACRQDEVAVVTRVASAARPAPGKLWVLSVVTKEDLWWPDRRDALAFYTAGPYAASVGPLAAAKGEQHFRHEVAAVSLVISNFLSERDVISKNVEGYDHRQQVESVRRVFEVFNALREWEAS